MKKPLVFLLLSCAAISLIHSEESGIRIGEYLQKAVSSIRGAAYGDGTCFFQILAPEKASLGSILTRLHAARITVKALEMAENPATYGTREYRPVEHLYDGLLPEYGKRIADLGDIPDGDRDAVVILYARGIIDLFGDNAFRMNEPVPDGEAARILGFLHGGKSRRQEAELKRYLSLFPDTARYALGEKDRFTIVMESQGSEYPVKTRCTIDETGKVSYWRSGVSYGFSFTPEERLEGRLRPKETEELFDFMMNRQHFFLLPADLSSDMQRMDASTMTMEILFNDKSHKVGGYDVMGHPLFRGPYDRMDEIIKKLKKQAGPQLPFVGLR